MRKIKEKLAFLRELQLVYSVGLSPAACADRFVSKYGRQLRFGLKRGENLSKLLGLLGWEKEVVFWLDNIQLTAENLQKIIKHYEVTAIFQARLIKALIYPSLTISVSLLILFVFIFFVFPSFEKVYADLAVTSNSDYRFPFWLLIILLFSIIYFFRERLKHWFEYWRWLPLKISVLEILSEQEEKIATCLAQIGANWQGAREAAYYLQKGSSLARALKIGGFLPEKEAEILAQAEELGQARPVLKVLANELRQGYYDRLEEILTWFEPIILILTGILVGIIAYQLFRPIVTITQGLL